MKALALIKMLPVVAALCVSCGVQPASGELQPALISEMTPQKRGELQRAVSEAMGGVKVTLGAKVFTETSLLVLERSSRQMQLNGREVGVPTKFKLFSDGSNCWLVRLPDGKRWALEILCSPADQN